jgi:hypothetical protein
MWGIGGVKSGFGLAGGPGCGAVGGVANGGRGRVLTKDESAYATAYDKKLVASAKATVTRGWQSKEASANEPRKHAVNRALIGVCLGCDMSGIGIRDWELGGERC